MNPRLELLGRGLAALGLDDSAGLLGRFGLFLDELELWNRKINLISSAGDELVVRHILDSLAGLAAIRERLGTAGPSLADIGSGAGFPGVPLALYLPGVDITLVEASRKRAAFLRTAAALLGLRNVTVSEDRLEKLAGAFDVVTLRAFKPLDAALLAKLERVMAPTGAIIAYKGRAEAVERELAGLRNSLAGSALFVEQVQLSVPFLDEQRCLLVVRRSLRT